MQRVCEYSEASCTFFEFSVLLQELAGLFVYWIFMAQPADVLLHMLGKGIFSGACKELLIPCEATNGLHF